jgi:hypothetical protein
MSSPLLANRKPLDRGAHQYKPGPNTLVHLCLQTFRFSQTPPSRFRIQVIDLSGETYTSTRRLHLLAIDGIKVE